MSSSTSFLPSSSFKRKLARSYVPGLRKSLAPSKGAASFTSKKVRAIARSVLSRRAEKRLKVTNINTTVTTTGNYQDLTTIAQGDAYYQRDGHQVTVKDVKITLDCLANATATNNTMRMLLIRWIPDTAADSPVDADIFEDSTNHAWLSPYKFDSRQFVVLFDRIISLEDGASNASKVVNVLIRKNLKTPVGYTAGANTGVNHLFMVLLGDEVTNGPTCQGHVSVRYTDV